MGRPRVIGLAEAYLEGRKKGEGRKEGIDPTKSGFKTDRQTVGEDPA